TGILIANGADLKRWLSKLTNNNAQGEYYITDIIALAYQEGRENSDGSGAARPDRVTLKLDKANYRPGDTMKLHIAAPVAGKGYA
ncbi:hypothetical protein MJM43_31930, partial [Salmonella enterica subsp. enterica serovar Montevideo]|nr:hypothetical protein [Salmonella enterica subsp. enterica serovar Montevideo]